MAIITPSSLISEIRGSAGDQTFSRNKYRAYVKQRAAPVITPTEFTEIARAYMREAVLAWQTLSQAQRDTFNENAKAFSTRSRLGQEKPLSGFNYYVRFAILVQRVLPDLPTSAEAIIPFPTFTTLQFNAFEGNLSFDVQPEFTNERFWLFLYASPPVNRSVQSPNSTQMTLVAERTLSAGLNVADFTLAWENRFGLTTDFLHQRVFAGVRIVDTLSGAISPMIIQTNFINGETPEPPVWPTVNNFAYEVDWNIGTSFTFAGCPLDITENGADQTFSIWVSYPQVANSPRPDIADYVQMVFDEPVSTLSTIFEFDGDFVAYFGEADNYIGQYVWAAIVFSDGTFFSDPIYTPAEIVTVS